MIEEASVPNIENDSKDLTIRKELTDKNILFLHHIKNGLKTIEAYELAGYKGNAHAAYELRSSLKNELALMLQGEGLGTREGLLLKLKKLQELPVAASVVSVKEALEILKLEAKLQPKEAKDAKPNITPIVINISGSATIGKNDTSDTKVGPLDVTPIEIKESV